MKKEFYIFHNSTPRHVETDYSMVFTRAAMYQDAVIVTMEDNKPTKAEYFDFRDPEDEIDEEGDW